MISWIQRTFQQHFRSIFGVLLAAIIVSFIIEIGATPGIGRAEHSLAHQDFFGHNLALNADHQSLIADADLSIAMQVGYNPYDQEQTNNYALQRAAALYLADQWHLPQPDTADITEFIKGLGRFRGANGQFDPQLYTEFRTRYASAEGAIARVLSDDVRIDHVQQLLAGPGYVQTADVKDELQRMATQWSLDTATVDYASFHASEQPTQAELQKYFQANAFKYEIPARVSASYVDFPASDYLAKVSVTDAEVKAYYDKDPSRFPKPTPPKPAAKNGKVPPIKVDPAADYAAVKPQVEAALKLDKAKELAARDASDFAYGLYESKVATGAPLEAYLTAHHFSEKPLPPFAEDASPLGSAEIAQAAFQLTPDRYYSEAMPTPTGAVVLLWKGNQPPRQPLLTEVEAKVRTDCIEDQRRKAFIALGNQIKTQIQTALGRHETFEKAATAAAAAHGVKITTHAIPSFKESDRNAPEVNATVISALGRLSAGQVSDMAVGSSGDGTIVYASAKKLPDLAATSPQFEAMRAQEAMYYSHLTAGEYLNQLVSRELQRSGASAE